MFITAVSLLFLIKRSVFGEPGHPHLEFLGVTPREIIARYEKREKKEIFSLRLIKIQFSPSISYFLSNQQNDNHKTIKKQKKKKISSTSKCDTMKTLIY